MAQDSRLRSDSSEETTTWKQTASTQSTPEIPPQHKVAEVARTLVAYGGGSVAIGLALDLVLNEVVEQARTATGATGAAIGFMRDGEMVCRATTGESAPDLGVRVDASSGLVGACVRSREVQLIQNAETDARVNAESCKRLDVRSMVIIPLLEEGEVFGILQAFSSHPDAFGESEISTLHVLAGKIAESKKEVDAGMDISSTPSGRREDHPASYDGIPEISQDHPRSESHPFAATDETMVSKGSEIWSTVLVLLVIAAAVLLGVEVGWHRAATDARGPAASVPASAAVNSAKAADSVQQGDADKTADVLATPKSATPATAPNTPVGGLIVTQDGHVIYRSPEETDRTTGRRSVRAANQPIHRVEPEYPVEAQQRHLQGSVVLDVQILKDGTVGNVSTVTGDPILADSAMRAVRQWRYSPNLINGQPVEGQATITVNFKLPST